MRRERAGEPLIDCMFVNSTLVLVVASCIAGPILTLCYTATASELRQRILLLLLRPLHSSDGTGDLTS